MTDPNQIVLDVITGLCDPEVPVTLESELVADLGIDSAIAVELLVELEDRLNIEIDDDALGDLHTVAHVVAIIQKHLG